MIWVEISISSTLDKHRCHVYINNNVVTFVKQSWIIQTISSDTFKLEPNTALCFVYPVFCHNFDDYSCCAHGMLLFFF